MFKVEDNVLEVTEKYKYLGVIFSEKCNFNLNATTWQKVEVERLVPLSQSYKTLKNSELRLSKNCTVLVQYLYSTTSRPFGVTKIIMTLIPFRIGP